MDMAAVELAARDTCYDPGPAEEIVDSAMDEEIGENHKANAGGPKFTS